MHPNLAKAAMEFLLRANLSGSEVQAFTAVMTALQMLAEPLPAPVEPMEESPEV